MAQVSIWGLMRSATDSLLLGVRKSGMRRSLRFQVRPRRGPRPPATVPERLAGLRNGIWVGYATEDLHPKACCETHWGMNPSALGWSYLDGKESTYPRDCPSPNASAASSPALATTPKPAHAAQWPLARTPTLLRKTGSWTSPAPLHPAGLISTMRRASVYNDREECRNTEKWSATERCVARTVWQARKDPWQSLRSLRKTWSRKTTGTITLTSIRLPRSERAMST